MSTENDNESIISGQEDVVEEELVFVDLPELSRFEIFDGMKTTIENLSYNESKKIMKFELNIESKENISEDELIKFKFQGNSLKTVGTCMFFNINNEHENHTPFKQSYSYNDNIEINNSNNIDKMNEKTTSKIEYIGKCNSVIQAFIQD